MDNYIDAFVEICLQKGRLLNESSNEIRHQRAIESQVDELSENHRASDQNVMGEEMMQAKEQLWEQDEKRLYQQGIRDCVAVLKEWGVLL